MRDIIKDWQWLVDHMFRIVNEMESDEEITAFVVCKIESLVTQHNLTTPMAEELSHSGSDHVVAAKFRERFAMPEDESLVNYYSCK